MQTKTSYRVLKWSLLAGVLASLGACVVTTGDGTDLSDGGESNSPTAGKTSTGGISSTGGKTGTGGSSSTAGTSSGGTSSGGTTATPGGSAGEGGEASTYVPGACMAALPTSSVAPSCDLDAKDQDPDNACRTCLKTKCCSKWKTCFGSVPTTACGSGPTEESDGQFECMRQCYLEDTSGDDPEVVLGTCESECVGQCEDVDSGFATDETQDLLGCGQDSCLTECFTP